MAIKAKRVRLDLKVEQALLEVQVPLVIKVIRDRRVKLVPQVVTDPRVRKVK